MPSIAVYNLGKKYKRYGNQRSRLLEWISMGKIVKHEERWALRGIQFKVNKGESLGVIGQNGAGKSTLLKILTGTTMPDTGSVEIEGKVASLLELGTGFHADFTGRENAIMACRMAGYEEHEINNLIKDIIDFSELGDYFDQPLRIYSTGMQMRIAFSSVTAKRPDVLIVDEALAVGDAYFSQKCIRRIRTFKEKGTTLIFVSHDPGTVKTLCNRAILIDNGIMIKEGDPQFVFDYYNAMIAKKSKDEEIKQIENKHGKMVTRSGSHDAYIDNFEMYNDKNTPTRAFSVGEFARIRCNVYCKTKIVQPTFGILIRDRLGNDIFGTNTYHLQYKSATYHSGDVIDVEFVLKLNLGIGNYSLCLAVHTGDTHLEINYDWWDQCMVFQIVPKDSYLFVGVASLPIEAKISKLTKNEIK